jgi:hypothetical protein
VPASSFQALSVQGHGLSSIDDGPWESNGYAWRGWLGELIGRGFGGGKCKLVTPHDIKARFFSGYGVKSIGAAYSDFSSTIGS